MEYKKTLKKQQGFSLIELMVVVAIIGVLSTIAVPQVSKWLAKAKQTEAKSNLSSIYTAMKAFFAEHQRYHGNFNAIGYEPEGNLRYRIGFLTGGGALTNVVGVASADLANDDFNTGDANICGVVGTTNTAVNCFEFRTRTPVLPTSTWAAGTFTAGAGGDIDGDSDMDQWTMDHRKQLTYVASDL